MADKSEDSVGLGCLIGGIIFLAMGGLQVWIMISTITSWVGNTVLVGHLL